MSNSKFTILDYYNERNKDVNYVKEFQSTASKKSGKTFWYINTNIRFIMSFINCMQKFIKYNGISREYWEQYINGEEKAKHWTKRMQQSKLFTRKDGIYTLTAKGESFKKFLEYKKNNGLNENEIWLFTYYYILNAYFDLKPNYIIKRCKEVISIMENNGLNYLEFKNACEEYFLNLPSNKIDMFEKDAFWYLTFFKDKDFITLYKSSSKNEKENLVRKVQIESKNPNSNDLIAYKFKDKGQYCLSSITDDLKVLYVTNELLKLDNKDFLIFFDNLYSILDNFFVMEKNRIEPFFRENHDIFEVIFNEAIKNICLDDELNLEISDNDIVNDSKIEKTKVDDTTSKTAKAIRNTSQILKRLARDKANNKCELERLNICRYFTSKESNENYLEIHHLIPYEFNNEFENTLETISNYVALCPFCHRLIHNGTDRERLQSIAFLYNERKDELKRVGLEITLKQLLLYYGFDEEEIKNIGK